MAQSEFIPQSSSVIVDATNEIKENDKLVEYSLLQLQGLDHESATHEIKENENLAKDSGQQLQGLDRESGTSVQSAGDSNIASESYFEGQMENGDLASETEKFAPEATSTKVNEGSSPVDASVGSVDSISPSNLSEEEEMTRIHIDTKAPFESVKAAVSKFGGIVDWKAHKVHAVERNKVIEQELEKVQGEIPQYREQAEIAEQSKNQMLKDLEDISSDIEDLKRNLERAQTEERQAKQDCQLVQQREEEFELEIAQEAGVVVKTELEVAKARYTAAVTDLKAVKDELEGLQKEYAILLSEKEAAEKKAEEAISASKELEKRVEELKVELIAIEESLESERAIHLEDERKRAAVVMAKEQDILKCDNDLKEAEDDLENLNKQIVSAKDLKSKVDKASSLLKELKAELVAFMDAKVNEEKDGDKIDTGMPVAVAAAYKELKDLKFSIKKATDEVNCLKVATTSLKAELEEEESELANLKQREGAASATVSSLEAELARIKLEIAALQTEEKKASEKLQQASQEAGEAKSAAELAHEELKKAEDEAEQAKVAVNTIERRFLAAQKEIEVVQATQKLAQDATKALKTSESTQTTNDEEDLDDGVALSLEEYHELSKGAHEAEEEANMKVTAALSKLDAVKDSKSKSLKQLEDVGREVEERKEAVRIAMQNAEKAKEAKLAVEQELRKWRAEHELRRKAAELAQVSVSSPRKNNEDVQGLKGVDPSMGEGLRIGKVVETSSALVAYGQGLGLKTLEQLTQYSSPKVERPSPKADGVSPSVGGPSPKADGVSPSVGGPSPKADVESPSAGGPSPKANVISPIVNGLSPKADGLSPKGILGQSNTIKKKKRSFFPRFFMFFTRRRSKQ